MLGSYRLLRQIAHVSVHIAQDHIATAFHFLISNRLPNFSFPCTAQPKLQLEPLYYASCVRMAFTFLLSLSSCCASTSMASASSPMASPAGCEASPYQQCIQIRTRKNSRGGWTAVTLTFVQTSTSHMRMPETVIASP